VIKNAPKVAEGAKKLWSSVGKKSPVQAVSDDNVNRAPLTESESIALLQSRLTSMESELSELHNQMLASSDLIKTLAEQNAQLIKHIEENRVRIKWLAVVVALMVVVVVLSLVPGL
jgi:cytochrome c-type biogenesis protein CcmH/NrfG